MTFEQAVKNLVEKFGGFGITEDMAFKAIADGVKDSGFSVRGAYNITRMAWADCIRKETGYEGHEYFTVEDIMSITGETREECIKRVEDMLQRVKEMGGNPDDYAVGIKPSVFYFPHGLK